MQKGPNLSYGCMENRNGLEIFNLGVIDYFKESIFLIEWANKIEKYLPITKLSIKIEYSKNLRTTRRFMEMKIGKKIRK